jgi:hypothetical protein
MQSSTSEQRRSVRCLVLLAAAACTTEATPAPAAPPVPPPSVSVSEEKPVPSDPYSSASQLVDRLAALPVLSKLAVEGVLGVNLQHLSSQPPQYLYYEALLPSGPFSRVEVREPNPTQQRFELAFLEVRPGVELLIDSFRKDGRVDASMPMDVNPQIPPEGTLTYSRRSAEQSVHYQFTARSQRLRLVAFHRPAD